MTTFQRQSLESEAKNVSTDLGVLNDTITRLQAQGTLSVSDVQTEISRIQNNADQIIAMVRQIPEEKE